MSTSSTSDPRIPESTPKPVEPLATNDAAGSSTTAPAASPRSSRSATFLAAAILVIVTLACFQMLTRHPFDLLVGPQRGGGNDLTAYYMGSHSVGRIGVSRFREIPRWNPYAATGGPRWGNPQSGCWYPPNWIFYVCNAGCALGWMMVAHQWWGGFGVYLLCRRLGFSQLSALVGGGLYVAAPYNVAHLAEGHYGQICVVSWIPWALLAYERFRQDPVGGLPRVSLVLALSILAGHVQEAYYLAVGLTLFAGIDAVQRLRTQGWSAAARFIGRWCCAGLLTGALVAVDFVPCVSYAKQSLRSAGFQAGSGTQAGTDLANLWQLLRPDALGGPEAHQGPGGFYCETLCHFGLAGLFLAAISVSYSWRRYPVRRYACVCLVAFGFALGAEGPVYWLFRSLIPGVAFFRGPNRTLFLCTAVITVLAAAGLEALGQVARNDERQVRRRVVWALAIGAVIVLGMLELGLHAGAVLRTVPSDNVRHGGPITGFLHERAGFDRVLAQQQLLGDREASEAGLYKVHGYEPIPLTRYTLTMRALNGLRQPDSLILGFEALDLRNLYQPVLDLLGVRYAVVRPSNQVDQKCWRVVRRGRVSGPLALRGRTLGQLDYWILENRTALPRAFVVGEARILRAGEDASHALTELDPRREVLLAKDLLGAGPRSDFQQARILEYSANRVTVEVTLQQPGYLVLTDTWYPGWTAEDNGGPAALVPANLVCRAVPLRPGRHVVVFRYGWSVYLGGMMLSALALVFAIRAMLRQERPSKTA